MRGKTPGRTARLKTVSVDVRIRPPVRGLPPTPGRQPGRRPWLPVLWSSAMSGVAGPDSLQQHAAEHLRFIRDTMARASGFTAVPGWGGAWMGVTAMVTATLAGPPGETRWLGWWLAGAAVAFGIGLVAMVRKAQRVGAPLHGTAARRFALAFVPALAAAIVLTVVFVRRGFVADLPGCWLLL